MKALGMRRPAAWMLALSAIAAAASVAWTGWMFLVYVGVVRMPRALAWLSPVEWMMALLIGVACAVAYFTRQR